MRNKNSMGMIICAFILLLIIYKFGLHAATTIIDRYKMNEIKDVYPEIIMVGIVSSILIVVLCGGPKKIISYFRRRK
jgi:hypothetical protein